VTLRIVADRVIADAAAAFAGFGDVTLHDGRAIGRALLGDCDILLVRSVTRVDATLLAGTPVRFVGTATAGTDHIDEAWLRTHDVAFSAAPGCNARAVGEYVLACVLARAAALGRRPDELSCGIVGCGHAGSAALALLETVGVRCLRNDPPRAAHTPGFVSLAEALTADIVSLHVPLTAAGDHPTTGLIGARAIAGMQPGALLINAARGGIVDEPAWLRAIADGRISAVVDCWAGEPVVSPALLAAAWVATPHIAGHTIDARLRATRQLRTTLEAWCRAQGSAVGTWQPAAAAPLPPLVLPPGDAWATLGAAVTACCSPLAQTVLMRAGLADDTPGTFDRLRAQFGQRREFGIRPVALSQAAPDTSSLLQGLGFSLDTA